MISLLAISLLTTALLTTSSLRAVSLLRGPLEDIVHRFAWQAEFDRHLMPVDNRG